MNIEKSSTTKKVVYPIYEMENKGRLILPMEVINQIMYLHATFGKNEWSGILLYDVINGNPSKPADFVLEAKHIFLMDVGSAASTEYKTDGDIVDIYDKIEGAMEMKIGHVHSHHDMSAFFSETDTSELMDNVDKHNYYLSFIVNFSGNYVAKIAFLSERKVMSWMHYTNDHGELKKFKEETTEETMIIVNMIIQLKYNDSFFYNRIDEVKEKRREEEKQKKITEKEKEKKFKTSKYPYQKSFYGFDDNFEEMHKQEMVNGFVKPEPKDMTISDIEALTRNLLSVNPSLTESRSVYQVLNVLTDAKKDEKTYYYDYFENNMLTILLSFFERKELKKDEVEAILKEVIMSVQRFKFHKHLESIVSELVKRMNKFYKDYNDMDSELEEINKAVKSYDKD